MIINYFFLFYYMASVHTCVTEAKDVTSSFFLWPELGMIGTSGCGRFFPSLFVLLKY